MKKFRPYNGGYILVYVITVACVAQALYSLIAVQANGGDTSSDPFFLWTLLLAPLAAIYGYRYYKTIVEISPTHVHLVRPVLATPKPGEKRANFLFRQGENDNIMISRTFELNQLDKYGFIEDFGLKAEDKSGAKETAKLFPLHEVAFIMKDGRNCRFNAAIYSKKQLKNIFSAIREATGIEPMGKLAAALSDASGK